METVLFLLAILSIFLTFWWGGILVTKCVGLVTGKVARVETAGYVITSIPVTYLIWFFCMRGGN